MNSWRRQSLWGIGRNLATAASAAVVLCGAVPRDLAGQELDPALKITQHRVRVWTDEDGLPQNSAIAILQLRDGTVLVGTQDGLARFDGSKIGPPGWGPLADVGAVWVNRLLEDPDGTVWIATRGHGLVRAGRNRVTFLRDSAGLRGESVEALHRDAAGNLWIGTSDAGLFRLDGARVVPVPVGDSPGAEFVHAISSDSRGRMIVGTRDGLFAGAPGRWRRFGRADGLRSDHVYSLWRGPADTVWVGTADGGLATLAGNVVRPARGWAGSAGSITAIRRDRTGSIWLGTNGAGLYRLYRGRTETLTTANGFPSNLVWSLASDDGGGLWVGTNGGGVVRLEDPPVTVFGASEGLSSDVALATLESRDGIVWVGTAGGGLNAIVGNSVRNFTTADGLATNIVTALHEDSDGVLWIGTAPRGLQSLRDGRITRVSADTLFSGAGINTIRADARGRLWVGSNGAGLGLRDGTDWCVLREGAGGLPSNFVQALAVDSTGVMYVATRAGAAAIRGDRLERLPVFADPVKNVLLALHFSPSGSLWLGGQAPGLARFRNGRMVHLGPDRGLPDQGVNGILEDSSGTLWLTTNRGIHAVRRTELEEVFDGKRERVTGYVLGTAEGMRSRETNGGVDPPGWVGRDGRIWVPTILGVVSIDPSRMSGAPPPRLSVLGVDVGTTRIPMRPGLRLPADTRRVRIAFRAMSFTPPDGIIVQYRLRGVDRDWVNAGASRVAEYTTLPAGSQLFEVRARHRLGEWGPVVTTAFRREPRWFEHPAVQVVALLIVAGLLLAAHRVRLRYWKEEAGRQKSSAAEKESVLTAVRERETRFSALLEHASDAIFVLDVSGRISYVSPSMERLTSLTSRELLGRLLVDVIHADDRAKVAAAIELIGTRPREPVPFRYRVELANVGWRTFSAVGRNLIDEPVVGGMIVNARDVTEQEEAESLFRQAQKIDAIGNLAGGIAHDFNNLLAVISANASMLKDDLAEVNVEVEGLDEIAHATKGGQRLTQQLLSFSRQQPAHPTVVDLSAVVQETVPMLRPLLGSDVRLVVETLPGPAPVYIDRGEVEQVVVNLVVNAKAAMPRGGTVSVIVSRASEGNVDGSAHLPRGSYVVLSVRDTGTGMDEATRSKIFEPFFTTKATGTGLGLATVSWIAKKAHGFVRVESEVEVGSVFTVHLPIVEGAPSPLPAKRDSRLGGTVVLAVDDNAAVCALAARVLRGAGADVLTAQAAESALDIARTHQGNIDVLLTDLVMPGMSGRELAARFVELRPVTVLYMSGYDDPEISRTRAEGRNVGFLAKPFKPGELVAAVEEAVRGGAVPAS